MKYWSSNQYNYHRAGEIWHENLTNKKLKIYLCHLSWN